jgi:hypothetical protein
MSLQFADNCTHRVTRTHDRFIMDVLANEALTPMELRHINAIRIHLQEVLTLSGIATADGKCITDEVMKGITSTRTRTSDLPNWICQPDTTKEQRKLWNSALSKYFLHNESQYSQDTFGTLDW